MSPLGVRRYRAERLLRDEFEALRARVLGSVAGRLRSCGVHLDDADLEACYSQAWQGLYAAVLGGARIDSTSAWLALVTYRRAIDEHRARRALASEPLEVGTGVAGDVRRVTAAACGQGGAEQDIASRLDDRAQLRQLFEALRVQLTAREQQAATLCYLQGLSRAEAAVRMGVSESRMRKLMEGRGSRAPGVASKMGTLVQTIAAGGWCEQQGSLMRGLAYGILDPDGERHRLATLHRDACPACRAYVISLRGLAAVLPPVPLLLHWAIGAGASGLAGTGAGAAAGGGAGGSASGSGTAGTSLGGSALAAPGAAGAGAAGGSWWLAGGPFGAKLAVSCLVALGVGAGCAALGGPARPHARPHRHRGAESAHAGPRRASESSVAAPGPATEAPARQAAAAGSRVTGSVPAAAQAGREFGPEQPSASDAARTPPAGTTDSTASAASVERPPARQESQRAASGAAAQPGTGSAAGATASPAAQREFAPG